MTIPLSHGASHGCVACTSYACVGYECMRECGIVNNYWDFYKCDWLCEFFETMTVFFVTINGVPLSLNKIKSYLEP